MIDLPELFPDSASSIVPTSAHLTHCGSFRRFDSGGFEPQVHWPRRETQPAVAWPLLPVSASQSDQQGQPLHVPQLHGSKESKVRDKTGITTTTIQNYTSLPEEKAPAIARSNSQALSWRPVETDGNWMYVPVNEASWCLGDEFLIPEMASSKGQQLRPTGPGMQPIKSLIGRSCCLCMHGPQPTLTWTNTVVLSVNITPTASIPIPVFVSERQGPDMYGSNILDSSSNCSGYRRIDQTNNLILKYHHVICWYYL